MRVKTRVKAGITLCFLSLAIFLGSIWARVFVDFSMELSEVLLATMMVFSLGGIGLITFPEKRDDFK